MKDINNSNGDGDGGLFKRRIIAPTSTTGEENRGKMNGSGGSSDEEKNRLLDKHETKEDSPQVGIKRTNRMESSDQPKLGLFTAAGFAIVLTMIFSEVSKQTANFSLSYYNNGAYPIPNTFLVVLTEFTKLVSILIISKGVCPIAKNGLSVRELRSSAKYLVPSVLYAINNNIFLIGLTLVAPPIFIILISVRTVITACVYKFILKRPITRHQMFGAFLIMISLAIAKAPDILSLIFKESGAASDDLKSSAVNAVPLSAILLALTAACISVTAAIYTEKLFKSGSGTDTFLDQQFWLYLYGTMVATLIHCSYKSYFIPSFIIDFQGMSAFLRIVLLLAVFFGSIGGLVTASILKHLDNVVKEYSAYSSNIATAIISSFLFPDKFQLTIYMMMSMAVLFTGVFFYERFKAQPQPASSVQPAKYEQKPV